MNTHVDKSLVKTQRPKDRMGKIGERVGKTTKDEYYQKNWCFAFCAIMVGTCLANLGLGLENALGISQRLVSNICKLLILLSLLRCFGSFFWTNILNVLTLVISTWFICLIQVMLFPQYNSWFFPALEDFIVLCIPMIVCIMQIHDYDMLLVMVTRASVLLSLVIVVFLSLYGGRLFSHYAMGFSGSLVFPTNVLLLSALRSSEHRKTRFIYAGCALIDTVAILLYGSRGSLVAVALCFAVQLMDFKHADLRLVLVKILLIICVISTLYFMDSILEAIMSWQQAHGFSSRTLAMLAHGNTLSDSGRIQIWQSVWEDFLREPFAMRGICSEYPIAGGYSHSIVLDVLHCFGLILGVPLLCTLLFLVVVTYKRASSDSESVFAFLLLSVNCPVLLWTGTFWTQPYFWSWLVCVIREGINESSWHTKAVYSLTNDAYKIDKREAI